MENFVKVWAWDDAPEAYRKLSTNGGDEDWVAFIPEHLKNKWFGWMEAGSPFGCCCVDEYEVEGGRVRIGAHA